MRDMSSSSRSSNGSLTRDRVTEFTKPEVTSYRRNENIGITSSITSTTYVPSRVSTAAIKYDPIVTKAWDQPSHQHVNEKYLNLNTLQRHSTLAGPSISNRSETTIGYNAPSSSLGVNNGSF